MLGGLACLGENGVPPKFARLPLGRQEVLIGQKSGLLGNDYVALGPTKRTCLSESQELPLHVSMAQSPLGIHHLLSVTMVPSGSTHALASAAVVELHWRWFFRRFPLGHRSLLHRFLGGLQGVTASWFHP